MVKSNFLMKCSTACQRDHSEEVVLLQLTTFWPEDPCNRLYPAAITAGLINSMLGSGDDSLPAEMAASDGPQMTEKMSPSSSGLVGSHERKGVVA